MSYKLNQMAEAWARKKYPDEDEGSLMERVFVINDFKAGHASRDADVTKLQSDLKKAVEEIAMLKEKYVQK